MLERLQARDTSADSADAIVVSHKNQLKHYQQSVLDSVLPHFQAQGPVALVDSSGDVGAACAAFETMVRAYMARREEEAAA